MYLERHLENKLRSIAQAAKIILITGARQVGKSTLLSHCFPDFQHITFDPVQDFMNVRQDPDLFVQQFKKPVILDEVQFYPEVLSAIKRHADRSQEPGRYFLSGSQNLSVLKNVAESMAGRVAILNLSPMTIHEQHSTPHQHWLPLLLDNPHKLPSCFKGIIQKFTLWEALWRGGMPGTLTIEESLVPTFRDSYISTYVERDIRLVEDVRDLSTFDRFIRILCALSSQEIIERELSRTLEVSHPTIGRWINLLIHTYQWHQIPPYHANTLKRITKRPKGVISDTGTACHLLRLNSPLAVGTYPQVGALFESFIVNQITALLGSLKEKVNLYHWRIQSGAEVDIIIEKDNVLYPIEVKSKTVLSKKDGRGIQSFRDAYPHKHIAPGVILYPGNHCFYVAENLIAVPCHGLFEENSL